MSAQSSILVIDDDIAVRLRVADLIASAGDFAFHEADGGARGLRAARELRPDLILLDIMMPDISGFDVCRALRADPETRELPIIVLSAADESDAMIQALEVGADDFLRKPFSAFELRAKIKTVTRLNRFRALVAERDRFRWLLDHSLEPMIVADDAGAVVYANPRAREIFALPAGDDIDVVAAITRHFRSEPPDAWAAWREQRLPGDATFSIYEPETEQVAARWYDVELHAFEGAQRQTLLKFTNRSGSVRRELETFTFQHLISHKIRTPLNGLGPILTFLHASEHASTDTQTADLLRVARESAERLEQTLTGVLDYHALIFGDRGHSMPVAPKDFWTVIAAAAESAELRGSLNLPSAPLETVQPHVLEVVLGEVLANYRKFSTADEAGVEVTVAESSTQLEVRLFAPGVGLPPDVVTQLGRPYAQLERKFSGEVPGMGLGLATVRILLRSLGGDLVFANHPTTPGLVTTLFVPRSILYPASGHVEHARA